MFCACDSHLVACCITVIAEAWAGHRSYASDDYQKLLRVARVTCSMSRKGNCWDNAPAESFFATLKRELIHGRNFRTRAEAKSAIFEFIESWYNRERLHSSLGYMSPVEFEAANNHQITKMAA